MTDALFLLQNRKNITTFNKQPVPSDVLSEILNCGRITPTGKHEQSWKYVVIKDDSIKYKISSILEENYWEDAGVIVAFFSLSKPNYVEYSSASTEAMLVAADNYKVGSYWQILHKQPLENEIKKLLNAPEEYNLMSLIALGYYNFTLPSFEKHASLSEIIIYDKFK